MVNPFLTKWGTVFSDGYSNVKLALNTAVPIFVQEASNISKSQRIGESKRPGDTDVASSGATVGEATVPGKLRRWWSKFRGKSRRVGLDRSMPRRRDGSREDGDDGKGQDVYEYRQDDGDVSENSFSMEQVKTKVHDFEWLTEEFIEGQFASFGKSRINTVDLLFLFVWGHIRYLCLVLLNGANVIVFGGWKYVQPLYFIIIWGFFLWSYAISAIITAFAVVAFPNFSDMPLA